MSIFHVFLCLSLWSSSFYNYLKLFIQTFSKFVLMKFLIYFYITVRWYHCGYILHKNHISMWEKQVIKDSEIAHSNMNFSVLLTLDYSILQRSTVFTPIGWSITSLHICIKCSIARHAHIDHSCGLLLTSARFSHCKSLNEWTRLHIGNAGRKPHSSNICWGREASSGLRERQRKREPHTHTHLTGVIEPHLFTKWQEAKLLPPTHHTNPHTRSSS